MDSKNNYCLNCGNELQAPDNFCRTCGQRKKQYVLKVREIGDQVFSAVFNIDNTFFKTFRLLPTPWQLTRKFVAGQRVPYYHPARLFIVLLFFLFSVTILFQEEPIDLVLGTDLFYTKNDYILKDSIDHLIKKIPDLKKHEKDIYAHLFQSKKIPHDTLLFEPFIVLKEIPKISLREVLTKDLEEIYSTYHITGFWEKIYVEQSVKMYKNNQDFISYFLKNALWSLPFAILFSSLFLVLLYYRHGIYYMEHVMLQFHFHSTIFAFLILGIILSYFLPDFSSDILIVFGSMTAILMPPLSFYKYYGQGIWKTLIKFLLYSIAYLVLVLIGIIFTLIFSAIFF